VVADVPYIRPSAGRRSGRLGKRGFARGRYVALALLLVVVAAVVVAGVFLATAKASLGSDSSALAKVAMPLGGGTIEHVDAITGAQNQPLPLQVRGDQLWPTRQVPVGQRVTVDVTIKRPGWISWLTGSTETLHLTLTAPAASLRTHYITVRGSGPLRLYFKSPIQKWASGATSTSLTPHTLGAATSAVTVARTSNAGTVFVSAAPRIWERAHPSAVSWFPAGGGATAVSNPAPGTTIQPGTAITLTFSKPVSKALGGHMPPVNPATQGTWHQLNAHSIIFRPEGYGYGLGAKVQVALPGGVHLVGGTSGGGANGGTWKVPGGSTVRLQQMLSLLGYLPFNFRYDGSGVGLTPQDQLDAAIHPPAGHFDWRYGNVPSPLRSMWAPGSYGELTKGAIMSFENDHGMIADGVPGPQVWKALITAVVNRQVSHFGYTFVDVNKATQSLDLWHSGKTVLTTPVNTGIAATPTASGTFAVFEHLTVTTMSGTNADGSHYSDPGIPWVSYFNGGDALHGFVRASYGFPQSDGCVEMPISTAGRVYPYTPIGTIVNVYG
jgi:peptidoglycan hydrolase-like protein with peptidoglycan-binding domain